MPDIDWHVFQRPGGLGFKSDESEVAFDSQEGQWTQTREHSALLLNREMMSQLSK